MGSTPLATDPRAAIQHYSMGGVRVNKDGEAYGMRGTVAPGRSRLSKLHGSTRARRSTTPRRDGGRRPRAERRREQRPRASRSTSVAQRLPRGRPSASRSGQQIVEPRPADTSTIRIASATVLNETVGVFRTGNELEQAVADARSELQRDHADGGLRRVPSAWIPSSPPPCGSRQIVPS